MEHNAEEIGGFFSFYWAGFELVTKFRTSKLTLAIKRGRYSNIERHLQYCDLCNTNIIGDEFHVLLECKNNDVSQYRTRFLRQYTNTANMFVFCKYYVININT